MKLSFIERGYINLNLTNLEQIRLELNAFKSCKNSGQPHAVQHKKRYTFLSNYRTYVWYASCYMKNSKKVTLYFVS